MASSVRFYSWGHLTGQGGPFTAGVDNNIVAMEWTAKCVEIGGGPFRMFMVNPKWLGGGQNWHSISGQYYTAPQDFYGNNNPYISNANPGGNIICQLALQLNRGARSRCTGGGATSLTHVSSFAIASIVAIDDAKAQVTLQAGELHDFKPGHRVKFSGVSGGSWGNLNGNVYTTQATDDDQEWFNFFVADSDTWGTHTADSGDVDMDLSEFQDEWVAIRPDTESEEARYITSATATSISWADPLDGPVSAGTQYDVDRHDRHMLNGVKLLADDSVPPYWRRTFVNTDNLNKGSSLSIRDATGSPSGLSLPFTVKYRLEKIGSVFEPSGNLCRRWEDGVWQPLEKFEGSPWYTGEYAVWRMYMGLDGGPMLPIYDHYVREDVGRSLMINTSPYPIYECLQEQHDEPEDYPTELHYQHFRVFDGNRNRWRVIQQHKVYQVQTGASGEVGWRLNDTAGTCEWLEYRGGHAGDGTGSINTVGYVFTHEFGHEETGGGSHTGRTPMSYQGQQSETFSGKVISGLTWRPAATSGTPYIIHDDTDNGWHILHPDASDAAALVYEAKVDGTYYFTGKVTRFNTAQNSGDGVNFHLQKNTDSPFYSVFVEDTHPVDIDDPFPKKIHAQGTGNATSGTTTQLYDTSQSWTDDLFNIVPNRMWIRFPERAGGGDEWRQIIDTVQASQELTLNTALSSAVSGGESYEIYEYGTATQEFTDESIALSAGDVVRAIVDNGGSGSSSFDATALILGVEYVTAGSVTAPGASVNFPVNQAHGLSQDAVIDLWTLDYSRLAGDEGNPEYMFYFTDAVASNGSKVSLSGRQYNPLVISVSSAERSSGARAPRARIRVTENVPGMIHSVVSASDDLKGATLRRDRIFRRHLDDGDTPDPSAVWHPPQVWRILQKLLSDNRFIEFDVGGKTDMEGVRLPAGRIEHNYCPHIYGPDRTSNDPVRCSWDNTAGPWFDADDQSVGTIGEDACGFRYTSCKARFTSIGKPLDFGGYPGIERIAQPGSRK